jgi:hypothetical protein
LALHSLDDSRLVTERRCKLAWFAAEDAEPGGNGPRPGFAMSPLWPLSSMKNVLVSRWFMTGRHVISPRLAVLTKSLLALSTPSDVAAQGS